MADIDGIDDGCHIRSVRITNQATTARSYDAIVVCAADLKFVCAINDGHGGDRQIRLAHRLAKAHGADWIVHPDLSQRVAAALQIAYPA